MKAFAFVLIASLLVVSSVASTKAGVKVTINEKALNYLKDEMLPVAEQAALSAEIPDMTEPVHVPVVGKVDMSLKDAKINYLNVSESSIVLNSGNAIAIKVSGLEIDVTLKWHYREKSWPHISDSGKGEAYTSHASGNVVIAFDTDSTGHPTAKITGCSFDLSGLSISLHGGASWLYEVFVSLFHSKIVNALDSAINSVVTTQVQAQLSELLASIPLQQVVSDKIAVDYSLVENNGIIISPDKYIIGQCAGEFFPNGGQPGKAPGQPAQMPDTVKDKHFQIFISGFSFESLGFTAVTTGMAEMLVTKDMAPAMAQDFFSTDFYAQYAPGIVDKYGSGVDVALFLAIHQTPSVVFSKADGIKVEAGIEMTVRAKNADGKFEDAFTLLLASKIDGEADVKGNQIFGSLTDIEATASLVQTHVGDIDISGFNDLITFAASMAIDTINEYLAKGSPLPTIPGVDYVDPSLTYGDGYAVVATDIHFTPQSHH